MEISNLDLFITVFNFGIRMALSLLAPLMVYLWIGFNTLPKTPFFQLDISKWLSATPKDYVLLAINIMALGSLLFHYYWLFNQFTL